jgi:hypothetical protein
MVIAVSGLGFEARIAAGAGTRVICSNDGRTLAASLACATGGDCRGLISFGVAGGLSPQSHAGMCVVGSAILSETTRYTTDRGWSRNVLQALPSAVYGPILGVPSPISNPMAAARVITDSAVRALPHSALAAMRADGTIDMVGLLRSMMREPGELPLLVRTALDALVGLAALLRGRHLLGPSFGMPDDESACANLKLSACTLCRTVATKCHRPRYHSQESQYQGAIHDVRDRRLVRTARA